MPDDADEPQRSVQWPWHHGPRPAPPAPGPAPHPPFPGPPPVPTPTHDVDLEQLLALHNRTRADRGLAALRVVASLDGTAAYVAGDNSGRGRLDHTSGDGRSPFQRMHDAGYAYTWAGENVAYGAATPDAVMSMWMHSPGHRANILNGHFTDVGLGVVTDEHGTRWWGADFGATTMGLAGAVAPPEPYETIHPDGGGAHAFRPPSQEP